MTVEVIVTRHGRQMYLTTDMYFSALLEKYGEYNYGEADLFQQIIRPGDTVVDAGANIGCHSLAMAKFVGSTGMVLSFEPQRPLYNCLCGTMALNEQWHVNAYLCALGEQGGTTKIPCVDYSLANSFGSMAVGHDDGIEVPVLALDNFDLKSLRFLKADVEGCELLVLRGAQETIARCRPFLYVENDRKENSPALIDAMRGMGYDLFLHTPTLFHSRNFRGNQDDAFPGVASIMLFGVPREIDVKGISLKPIECAEDMPAGIGEHKWPTDLRRASR